MTILIFQICISPLDCFSKILKYLALSILMLLLEFIINKIQFTSNTSLNTGTFDCYSYIFIYVFNWIWALLIVCARDYIANKYLWAHLMEWKILFFSFSNGIFQGSPSEILDLPKQNMHIFKITVASDHWNETAKVTEDASHRSRHCNTLILLLAFFYLVFSQSRKVKETVT